MWLTSVAVFPLLYNVYWQASRQIHIDGFEEQARQGTIISEPKELKKDIVQCVWKNRWKIDRLVDICFILRSNPTK